MDHAMADLNRIARQADDEFDPNLPWIVRAAKHHDVAARRAVAEQPTFRHMRVQWKGGRTPAIGKLRHNDVVASDQARLHRGGGDGEGLEQDDPQQDGHDQGDSQGGGDLLDFTPQGRAGRGSCLSLGHAP